MPCHIPAQGARLWPGLLCRDGTQGATGPPVHVFGAFPSRVAAMLDSVETTELP